MGMLFFAIIYIAHLAFTGLCVWYFKSAWPLLLLILIPSYKTTSSKSEEKEDVA